MNLALTLRLRFIDIMLEQYGSIQRRAITEVYGISAVQASIDLKAYLARAPGNMEYDLSGKCYRRADGFKRVLP